MYLYFFSLFLPLITTFVQKANAGNCDRKCETTDKEEVLCVFFEKSRDYKLFPSVCHLTAFKECNDVVDSFVSPLKFCIKNEAMKSRKFYGESCPVFCPEHYRPVCGASKLRDYAYRAFKNGCLMDMLNCRGVDEYLGYVEVPLHFCQRHAMKNIFKERVIVSGRQDYSDVL